MIKVLYKILYAIQVRCRSRAISTLYMSIFVFRPGFSRLNLAYFLDDETVDFILHAVDMVATHGWKLLPLVIKLSS